MKKKLIILVVLLSVIIGGGAIFTKGFRTIGHTKVDEYNTNPGCLAITASCGECYGEIIGDECYVDKKSLTQEQLEQMGLSQ